MPPPQAGASALVVMGVAGCGKSTIGRMLAARLDLPFVEADELHPAANVAKMHRGEPLSDADRAPWLANVAGRLRVAVAEGDGAVVSCSALRRAYRDVLQAAAPGATRFVHLTLDEATALARVSGRAGHFMPASLVASQFATLEPLQPDEPGIALPAVLAPDVIVADVMRWLTWPLRRPGR